MPRQHKNFEVDYWVYDVISRHTAIQLRTCLVLFDVEWENLMKVHQKCVPSPIYLEIIPPMLSIVRNAPQRQCICMSNNSIWYSSAKFDNFS